MPDPAIITGPTCRSCPHWQPPKMGNPLAANQPIDLAAPVKGECHEGPPAVNWVVVSANTPEGYATPGIGGFPPAWSNWWCGRHPKRRGGLLAGDG